MPSQADAEGMTPSLTRTPSWLWTLPLLRVWLIRLQSRTGGITVRDRGKSWDVHEPSSRADTLTFILLSMTILFPSLFHLLLLPIIASSPVSVLPVWSTLSLSTPPQQNKTKSVEIRAWSASDAGNNESHMLSTFFFFSHSYSRLNPERCVGTACGRREEAWKRWKQALSRKKRGERSVYLALRAWRDEEKEGLLMAFESLQPRWGEMKGMIVQIILYWEMCWDLIRRNSGRRLQLSVCLKSAPN